MDYEVVESQPNKAPRAYRKLKDSEPYKDFILQKQKAGVRQKDILAALKSEFGFELKLYHLKRNLEKWGISHKNLTKKRKLHIRRGIDKRQGVNTRVKLKRSKRVLKDEELDEIINLQPDYFKDSRNIEIKPSPGDIIFSTPTPGVDSRKDETDAMIEIPFNGNSSPVDQDNPPMDLGNDPNEIRVDNDVYSLHEEAMEDAEGEHIGLHESESESVNSDDGSDDGSVEFEYESVEPESDRPEDTIEDLQKAITAGIKAIGLEENPEADVIDEDLFEAITDGAECQYELLDGTSDIKNDWIEVLLRRYARLYEDDYRRWVDDWMRRATRVVRGVCELVEQGLSEEEAFDRVSVVYEQQTQHALPYQLCTRLLQTPSDSTKDSGGDGEEEEEEEEGKAILAYVDWLFSALYSWGDDHPISSLEHLANFRECVVHLPRIIQEHGFRSFFTALCLQETFDLLAGHYFDIFSDSLSLLVENSIGIFEEIGMGCHPEIWSQWYSKLTECRQRDLLLQRLRRHYGSPHLFMVEIDINKLTFMMEDGGVDDPVQSKTIRKLWLEIVHELEHADLRLNNVWAGGLYLALAGLLDFVCVADAIVIEKIIGKYVIGAKFLQGASEEPRGASMGAIALGIAYYKTQKLTLSLEMLIRACGISTQTSWAQGVSWALEMIHEVANARGPVLYTSLKPVLIHSYKLFSKAKRPNTEEVRIWRNLWAKCQASQRDRLGKEYSNILALQPLNRSSTPDFQEYLYHQEVKSWMYSQGICDIPDDLNLGGYIMEWEESEISTEMQVDTMSAEEELEMIVRRYRQAEAAGLIDADGRYIFV